MKKKKGQHFELTASHGVLVGIILMLLVFIFGKSYILPQSKEVTPLPTIDTQLPATTITPSPFPTTPPLQQSDPDPIVNCHTQHLGIIHIHNSECQSGIECEVSPGNWIWEKSDSQCVADQKASAPQRIPMVIDAHPWNPFTTYCDADKAQLIQSAVQANNDLNNQLEQCINNAPDFNAANGCYGAYPVGEKDHMYAQVLTDALNNYCGK